MTKLDYEKAARDRLPKQAAADDDDEIHNGIGWLKGYRSRDLADMIIAPGCAPAWKALAKEELRRRGHYRELVRNQDAGLRRGANR